MVGSNKMSLMGWQTLVEWSFQYSMITDEEKKGRIDVFSKEWEVFCAEIVQNCGKTAVY
jgi:adenosine deaminase CECR1